MYYSFALPKTNSLAPSHISRSFLLSIFFQPSITCPQGKKSEVRYPLFEWVWRPLLVSYIASAGQDFDENHASRETG